MIFLRPVGMMVVSFHICIMCQRPLPHLFHQLPKSSKLFQPLEYSDLAPRFLIVSNVIALNFCNELASEHDKF